MERPPRKCFRCGSEDHMIANFPKQVCFNEKVNYLSTTAKMIVTVRYMHIWHKCLAVMNGKIMVRLKTEIEHLCTRGDRVHHSLLTRVMYD